MYVFFLFPISYIAISELFLNFYFVVVMVLRTEEMEYFMSLLTENSVLSKNTYIA